MELTSNGLFILTRLTKLIIRYRIKININIEVPSLSANVETHQFLRKWQLSNLFSVDRLFAF